MIHNAVLTKPSNPHRKLTHGSVAPYRFYLIIFIVMLAVDLLVAQHFHFCMHHLINFLCPLPSWVLHRSASLINIRPIFRLLSSATASCHSSWSSAFVACSSLPSVANKNAPSGDQQMANLVHQRRCGTAVPW